MGQGVERVSRFVLHEVKQGRVGVVRGRDGGDLVVFVPSASSAAVASALTGVTLEKKKRHGVKTKLNFTSISKLHKTQEQMSVTTYCVRDDQTQQLLLFTFVMIAFGDCLETISSW